MVNKINKRPKRTALQVCIYGIHTQKYNNHFRCKLISDNIIISKCSEYQLATKVERIADKWVGYAYTQQRTGHKQWQLISVDFLRHISTERIIQIILWSEIPQLNFGVFCSEKPEGDFRFSTNLWNFLGQNTAEEKGLQTCHTTSSCGTH